MMSNDVRLSPDVKEISHPRFAAFYNRMMAWPAVRRAFESLRRETAGQAHGLVLEMGAGGGPNFPFFDPTRHVRGAAVEPVGVSLGNAQGRLAVALVPIPLSPNRDV